MSLLGALLDARAGVLREGAAEFVGVSDEQTECDLCGRSNLKRTVILRIGGAEVHYGSDCAAKALGWGENSGAKRQVEKLAGEAQVKREQEQERERRRALPETDATTWLKTKADPVIRAQFEKQYIYNDSLDAALRLRYAGMKNTRGRFPWEPRQ